MTTSAGSDPISIARRVAPEQDGAMAEAARVTLLRDADQLGARAGEWAALGAEALHGNPAGDAIMVEAALEHLARPGEDIRIALVERHDRLAGVFIFKVSHARWGLPVPVAVPWAHSFSFCGAPLVHRHGSAEVFAAFFEWLEREQGGLPILFGRIPAEGPLFAALEQFLISTGRRYRLFDCSRRAVLLADGDPEAWLAAALPSKKRKELRRQRKRLGELGALTFESLGPGDDAGPWCDQFMALEAAGWKGRRGNPLAGDPALAATVRQALAAEARAGQLGFWRLALDGRPVAMTFAVRRPPRAWLLKIAHDESLARFSPGVQLMIDVSQALIADPEVNWVDSCADAGHPMIEHLWRDRTAVTDLLVAGSGGPAAFDLLCAAEKLRRHARAQAKWLYHKVRRGAA